MASLKKRMTAMLLVITLLFSTPVFATEAEADETEMAETLEPVFSTNLSEIEGSQKITGSVMAAVSMDFRTGDYSSGSFSSIDEIPTEEDRDLYAALGISDGMEISGYQYFPETGETVAVTSPRFPEL